MTTPIWDWNWGQAVMKLCVVLVLVLGAGVIPFLGMMMSYEVVEQGEYGVVTQPGGEVVRVVGPGDHFIIPAYEDMTRVQSTETVTGSVTALSSDGVNVDIEYQSRLTISQAEAGDFYLKYGTNNIERRYSDPCTRASLRSESAKHNSTTLYEDYAPLENATMECETGEMAISVTDVTLPAAMEASIEEKKRMEAQQRQTSTTTTTASPA